MQLNNFPGCNELCLPRGRCLKVEEGKVKEEEVDEEEVEEVEEGER